MSSTAMHRGPYATYQRRTGRALEERTKAMIVTAAEQVMTAEGESIAHLTTADVCAAARGYVRRDGTEGPIPKATMWKHFKTIADLAAAVVDKMTAENRPVPDRIIELAAGPGHTEPRRDTVDVRRLEARYSSRNYEVAQLEEQFAAAADRDDRSDMLYWSAELAERRLRQRRRGDRDAIVAARDWARRGLRLVDVASRLDCMIGIRCARAAAEAETALSRRPDYEPTALSRIRSIKETEQEFASVLGWELHGALARFHAEHARALAEEDPEREMRAMRAVTNKLIELCAPDAAREPQDSLRADELGGLVVELRRLEMAYAAHPEHRELFAAVFGDGVAETTRRLLACFPATGGERPRHEGNVRALLRLDDLTRRLDGPEADIDAVLSAAENYEQAAVDLLRTAEFGTVRDILVARYLTAKARALALRQGDGERDKPADTDDLLMRPQPAGLIAAAIRYYEHAAKVTSTRGADGVLREHAARAGARLRRSSLLGDEPDDAVESADPGFDRIVEAINDLVLITVSRRNRFTDSEVQHLLDMVDPMYYYITSGRN
ncbi:hypothetical protein [Nocardia blacklockiae]|uniref:hypothetical protein n=1 Tax=Nocardia blacklockiae TaxID=480036 RepID=UPI0018938DFE|nr:hypothetical protein [Nocardia blacklockiae]MBF6173974.1 hypothetical protein [Nocardia blacklockiae]